MRLVFLLGAGLFSLFISCPSAFSVDEFKTDAEEAQYYNVTRSVKTVQGLNFRVVEDRPIEKVAGIYRPIDIDSYVALKFGKLLALIQELSKTTDERISELNKRVDVLTKQVEELTREKKKNEQPKNDTAVVSR